MNRLPEWLQCVLIGGGSGLILYWVSPPLDAMFGPWWFVAIMVAGLICLYLRESRAKPKILKQGEMKVDDAD
jgi:FtsH-binding integral membrane protein